MPIQACGNCGIGLPRRHCHAAGHSWCESAELTASRAELDALRGRLRDIIGVSSPSEQIEVNCEDLQRLLEGD